MNKKSRKYKKLMFIRSKNHKRWMNLKDDETITTYGMDVRSVNEMIDMGYRFQKVPPSLCVEE